MHRFIKSTERWWNKPLAAQGTKHLPAELAVLEAELRPGEQGAWLNSRGVITGVAELVRDSMGKFKTRRIELPRFVSSQLESIYEAAGLSKGAADLVIWNADTRLVRFVEVKCPDWDSPSDEQLRFLRAAEVNNCPMSIVEWEFCDA